METPPTTIKRTSLTNSSKSSTITPCRRLGLSRPSPAGGLKTFTKFDVAHTPERTTVIENKSACQKKVEYKNRIKKPFNTSDITDKNINCLETPPQEHSTVKRVLVENNIASNNSNNLIQLQLSKPIERIEASHQFKKRKLSFKSNSSNDDNKELNKTTSSILVKSFDNLCETSLEYVPKTNSGEFSSKEVTLEMIQQLFKKVKEKKNKLELLKVQEAYEKKHKLDELQAQTARWREAGQDALRYSLDLTRQAGVPVTLQQLMTQHGFPPHLMGYNDEYDEFD